MTNDEFILGLIDVNVQKGYDIPDKNTNTKYVDNGIFTFLYGGDIIRLERSSGFNRDTTYFFKILPPRTYTKSGKIYYISKETYEKAFEYFFEISDYDRLKKKLNKDIRKTKLDKIDDK